MTKAKFNV